MVPRQPYYKFILVALICTFSLEFPRFFEFELVHNVGRDNRTDYWTTALMEDER